MVKTPSSRSPKNVKPITNYFTPIPSTNPKKPKPKTFLDSWLGSKTGSTSTTHEKDDKDIIESSSSFQELVRNAEKNRDNANCAAGLTPPISCETDLGQDDMDDDVQNRSFVMESAESDLDSQDEAITISTNKNDSTPAGPVLQSIRDRKPPQSPSKIWTDFSFYSTESLSIGCPPSRETLRRLTLSPRKPTLAYRPSPLIKPPVRSFAEMLSPTLDDPTVPPTMPKGLHFSLSSDTDENDEDEDEKNKEGRNVNSQAILAALSARIRNPGSASKPQDTPVKNESMTSDDDQVQEPLVLRGSDPESDSDWDDTDINPHVAEGPIDSKLAEVPKSEDDIAADDDMLDPNQVAKSDVQPHAGSPVFISKAFEDSDSDFDDSFMNAPSKQFDFSLPTTFSMNGAKPYDGDDLDQDKLADDNATGKTGPRSSTRARKLSAKMIAAKSSASTITRQEPKRPKFSLDSLLKEKTRHEAIGYDLERAGRQQDEFMLEEYDDDMEEEIIFTGEPLALAALPQGVLTEEQTEVVSEVLGEGDKYIVEDATEFFVDWPPRGFRIPMLKLTSATKEVTLTEQEIQAEVTDVVFKKIMAVQRTLEQRVGLLMSPYLFLMSGSSWNMPRSVFCWLFDTMTIEPHQEAVSNIYRTLERTIQRQASSFGPNKLGVGLDALIRACQTYGARDLATSPAWRINETVMNASSERAPVLPKSIKFPQSNLKAILGLIATTAKYNRQIYDSTHVQALINLLMRIMTDPIVGNISFTMEVTIAALLDSLEESEWDQAHFNICRGLMETFGGSLPFLSLVLRQLTTLSSRMIQLRRTISYAALMGTKNMGADSASVIPVLSESTIALLLRSPATARSSAAAAIMAHDLLDILNSHPQFHITPKTNYRRMGEWVQVFAYCLEDELMVMNMGRGPVRQIELKLKRMHGKILDGGAAFMDRTTTKNTIQRLFSKLYYVYIHRQPTVAQPLLDGFLKK